MALITDILVCSDHLQHTGVDWDMTLACWADEPSTGQPIFKGP